MRIGNIDARGQAIFDDALATAGTPAISFDGDLDTGITRGGEDILILATGGAARLTIELNGTLNVTGTSTS